MESSIAEFLQRVDACELQPTIHHIGEQHCAQPWTVPFKQGLAFHVAALGTLKKLLP